MSIAYAIRKIWLCERSLYHWFGPADLSWREAQKQKALEVYVWQSALIVAHVISHGLLAGCTVPTVITRCEAVSVCELPGSQDCVEEELSEQKREVSSGIQPGVSRRRE